VLLLKAKRVLVQLDADSTYSSGEMGDPLGLVFSSVFHLGP